MNKKTSPLTAVVKKILLSGLVVEVEGEYGFVPRKELDWNDPRIDPTAHFKTGQEIPVVVIETSEGDGPRFSRKLAINDPWADKVEKYEAELRANRFPVVRGVVGDVTAQCVFVVLEDYNDAIIFPSGIPSSQKNDAVNLSELFSVGDHIEARIKEIRHKHRSFVLDISSHASNLANSRRKREAATWDATLGDILPQLSELGFQGKRENRRQGADFSNLRVLVIEDDKGDRENLGDILRRCTRNFIPPASKTELDSILEKPDSFDLVFLDKNLNNWEPGLTGNKFVDKILGQSPGVHIVVTTREGTEAAQNAFSSATSVEVVQKPLSKHEIEHFLLDALKTATVSSFAAMRRMDQDAKSKRDFLSMDQKLEDALDIVLRSLCKGTDGQVKAAVLRMDLTTQEIHCIRSYHLDEISWPDHKSTLRYTPIERVIRWDEPLMKIVMPESWKKHFPKEIQFVSFAGIPIQTFGETCHGLFLFGEASGSISEIYGIAHESALAIARLLERAMTDNILLQEALFASMGRLYMAMGHEIRDAVTGVKDLPGKLRQDIDALQIEDVKSKEQSKKIGDMRRTVDGLKKAGDRILKLFDFYADLGREDPIPQHIPLRRLVDEVVDDMKRRHCSQETIFKVKDIEPLIIEGSRTKLRQVLRNLVLNACQQMETSDTLCPYIEIRAFLDKGSPACPVKIMISDAGPGIHTKDWEKIFEPWQSTRKKGAGLGLYICRLLIRAMGGNIRIHDSFHFIGTTFIIELPKEMSNDRP